MPVTEIACHTVIPWKWMDSDGCHAHCLQMCIKSFASIQSLRDETVDNLLSDEQWCLDSDSYLQKIVQVSCQTWARYIYCGLHDSMGEELHNLCSSLKIIGMMKFWRMTQARHIACMGVKKNAYKILVGKPEEKRPLGRPRHRCENNINTLRTGRHFIGFWLLNVADREPIIWLFGDVMLQSTIHCSGAMFLCTIGPECFV
jgi:hypothetical protein